MLLPEGCSLLERLVCTQFGLESDFAQGFRLLAWFLFSKLATLFSNLCSGAVWCSLPISFMSTVPYSYHRADFQKAAETFIPWSKASEEKPMFLSCLLCSMAQLGVYTEKHLKNEQPKILFYATCVGRELFAIKKIQRNTVL